MQRQLISVGLLLLSTCGVFSSQVHFPIVDANTNAAKRTITVIPDPTQAIQRIGTNIFVQPTISVKGGSTTNLLPADYTWKIDGFNEVHHMSVPNTNVLLEAAALSGDLITYVWTNAPDLVLRQQLLEIGGLTTNDISLIVTGSAFPLPTDVSAANHAITNISILQATSLVGDGSKVKNLPGPVNPDDYGADPTGSADSTSAFIDAINAASNTLREVKVSAGFYRLSQPINIPNGITFGGNGAAHGSSYYPSATTLFSYNPNAPILVMGNRTCLRDLRVFGGATNDGSIGILIPTNTGWPVIINVGVSRCQIGICVSNSYGLDAHSPYVADCTIGWCFTNGGNNEINFFGGRTANCLDNIQITGGGRNINFWGHNSEKSARHCVAVTNYTGLSWIGDYHEGAFGGSEFALTAVDGFKLQGVTFTDSLDYELVINSCTNGTIENCVFSQLVGQQSILLANSYSIHEQNNRYNAGTTVAWRENADTIWWAGATTTPTFTVTKAGNIGVNTASPGVALDVNGAGSFSGNLSVGGTLASASGIPPRQPIAWYAPSGLTVSGPNVTGWTDASGNGHNATAQNSDGGPANAPTNVVSGYGGLPAVQFGYSNLLSTPLNLSPSYARPYTMYFLFKPQEPFSAASYLRAMFDGSYYDESAIVVATTSDKVYSSITAKDGDSDPGAWIYTLTDDQWTNNWHVYSVCFNSAGSSNYAQLDTTSYRAWLATGSGRTARAFSIGNNQPGTNGLPMLLSQVLICQGAHNSNDMATVRQWLLNSSNSASGLQIAGNVNQSGTNTASAFIGPHIGDGTGLSNVIAASSVTIKTNGVQLASGISSIDFQQGANATITGTRSPGAVVITIAGSATGAGIDEATATTIADTEAAKVTNGISSQFLQDKLGGLVYDTYGAASGVQSVIAAWPSSTASQNATNPIPTWTWNATSIYGSLSLTNIGGTNVNGWFSGGAYLTNLYVTNMTGPLANLTNAQGQTLSQILATNIAPLVAPGIIITNGGNFLSASSNIFLGAVWNVSTYPQYYLGTNASFSLSVAGLTGTGTNWQLGTLYITNRAGSASPIVVTLSGAWSTCLSVTGGMAAAFAITNDAYLTVNHLGATNAWATTR